MSWVQIGVRKNAMEEGQPASKKKIEGIEPSSLFDGRTARSPAVKFKQKSGKIWK